MTMNRETRNISKLVLTEEKEKILSDGEKEDGSEKRKRESSERGR